MLTRREILVCILAFAVTLPAVTVRLYASDEIEYFAWLRSVAFDRDADFQNEYQYFYDTGAARNDLFRETFLERKNEIGRAINFTPIGCAVLWAPAYAIGHVVALVTGAPADGFSRPYIAAVTYGSAALGLAAVLLSAAIARRVTGRGLTASLIIAIGSPLVFYVYVSPGFSHANSAFAVAFFLWLWLRARDRWTPAGAAALGASAALMAMVREQDAFIALGPALDFLAFAVRAARERTRPLSATLGSAAAGLAAFGLAFAPQLVAYHALNGHFGPTQLTLRKMTWTSPHALGVLFDPDHGLFFWTPLALVAVAGLVLTAARGRGPLADVRWIGALALLMIGTQVWASGSVESWTVAGSFGQRRFVALTPLLVVGLAAMLGAVSRTGARRALLVVVAICVWWNAGLMAQFGLHRMDRQRLTLTENARVTFVELPLEAPGLAWRYLTDRESFYRQPRQSPR